MNAAEKTAREGRGRRPREKAAAEGRGKRPREGILPRAINADLNRFFADDPRLGSIQEDQSPIGVKVANSFKMAVTIVIDRSLIYLYSVNAKISVLI